MLAFSKERRQQGFHPLQHGDFLLDTDQPCSGNLADRSAASASFKSQQFANFFERKTETLRPLYKPNLVDHRGRISAYTPSAMWDSQQIPALVIPYSFDPYLGRTREASYRQRNIGCLRADIRGNSAGGCIGHDLTPYLGTESRISY
jgi:hypothetical protein